MILTLQRGFFWGLLLFSSAEFLTGCSLFQDMWERDSIAEYGEAVFRRQNRITSQIMLLSESDLPAENLHKLQQAEAQMQQDCKLLNEYASREMDRAAIDLLFKKKVRDSIGGCDVSIQKIESTLLELGIKE